MSDSFASKCPFRAGTASRSLFMALTRSGKAPMSQIALSRQTKVPAKKTATILAAMTNSYHNAGLRRVGVSVVRSTNGYVLKATKPHPKAKRKPR